MTPRTEQKGTVQEMNGWKLRLYVLLQQSLARLGLKLPGKIMYIGGSDTLPPPLAREEESALIARLEQGEEAEYREALSAIAQKAGQMSAMVEQMLQMARMEGGRVSLRRERLDLSALCVAAAQETVRGKALDVSQVEPDVFLQGDELLLMRLVTLLTDNAARFARTRVVLSLRRQGAQALLRVSDDGPGIPPELRERVFDRFFQAEPHRSGAHGGAGLGLTLARGIAQLHGGELRVEDSGPGATLRLTLPCDSTEVEPHHRLRKSKK